jgi:hypothetical protein
MPTLSSSGPVAPAPLLLYSTNTYLKFHIQENFRGEHRVWCSPVFEAQKQNRYALGAGQPASSDPCTIYTSLHRAVAVSDDHDPKINSQRKVLSALAVDWCLAGKITEAQRDEIVAIVKNARFPDWRPLIFVIPFSPVQARLQLVDRANRASHEPEYIIPDLKRGEFDIIEPSTS